MPTLREYANRWSKGVAVAALRERTARDYMAALERHVYPTLGGARLDSIHTTRIEVNVVASLRAKGHLRMARLTVSALLRVYRSAIKDPTLGLVGNPCAVNRWATTKADRPKNRG